MFIISETKTWIPFYLLLIFWMWRVVKWKIWLVLIGIALVITFSDAFTSRFMKPFFARPRPSREVSLQEQVHTVNNYRGGAYGFASSHAANSFGLAMFLWLVFRKNWRWVNFLWLWALIVSYSRIYLGVHYPLDILVGAFVGITGAYFIFLLYLWVHGLIYGKQASLPKN